MEVVKGFWRERVIPLWVAFATALGDFVEEVLFRVKLASCVLIGRVPRKEERRFWNRATETPVLVDVYDWTDDRLICSALIWPRLDENYPSMAAAQRAQDERVEEVIRVIGRGATEMMWSTYWHVDYGLRWDNARRAWVSSAGHAYDGERLYDYSRSRNGAA